MKTRPCIVARALWIVCMLLTAAVAGALWGRSVRCSDALVWCIVHSQPATYQQRSWAVSISNGELCGRYGSSILSGSFIAARDAYKVPPGLKRYHSVDPAEFYPWYGDDIPYERDWHGFIWHSEDVDSNTDPERVKNPEAFEPGRHVEHFRCLAVPLYSIVGLFAVLGSAPVFAWRRRRNCTAGFVFFHRRPNRHDAPSTRWRSNR